MGQDGGAISGTGFSDMDATERPATFVEHQDRLNALEGVRAYKRQTYALLAPRPGERVLDVGCGTGDDVRALAELVGPTGRAVGVDRSETMVAQAQARSEGQALPVEFHVGDIYRLDFPDGTFDGCRADRVLHHLDDPDRALGELVRVTRPGGRVVVQEPDFDAYVIDHRNQELTRRILGVFAATAARNGCVGRRLYGWFRQRRLEEIVVQSVVVPTTDLSIAHAGFYLEATLERAQEDGVVTPAEAAAWLGDLQAASESGHFFAAGVGFIVAGRKSA